MAAGAGGVGIEEKWTEKYRPRSLAEVVGNRKAVEELRKWAKDCVEQPAILYGPPGCGKTSAAHALAAELGWEVIELNASDQRSAPVIKSVVGTASVSGTFSKKKRLIILDEADNIHGREDYGGMRALSEVLKRTRQPIILIANDVYKLPRPLRDRCKLIRFYRIRTDTVVKLLRRICEREHLDINEELLREVAENSNGDLRSAINDLQAVAAVKEMTVGRRDVRVTIFDALKKIFHGEDLLTALYALYDADENPEDAIMWVYENMPLEYEGKELLKGLRRLSRADVFLWRARRVGYRMWRYASFLMSAGVLAAKSREKKYRRKRRGGGYGVPWRARAVKFEHVVGKIGEQCNVSRAYARQFLIPPLRVMFEDEKMAAEVSAALSLDAEDVAALTGMSVEAAKKIISRVGGGSVEVKKTKKESEEEAGVAKAQANANLEAEVSEKGQRTLSDFFEA
ncbi:MAG: DNA polymerase III [Candidatus Alkanophagales archaeon MCA70_species_2]|nr:DNA polymerase III [Candidatus Alkanophaga liquidiphilum]